jgi:hypothetical protein
MTAKKVISMKTSAIPFVHLAVQNRFHVVKKNYELKYPASPHACS